MYFTFAVFHYHNNMALWYVRGTKRARDHEYDGHTETVRYRQLNACFMIVISTNGI